MGTSTPNRTPTSSGIRFSLKEALLLIAGTALSLGSFKLDDPWVVIPMLSLAAIAFIAMCAIHSGRWFYRVGISLIVILILLFIGWRDLRHPQPAVSGGSPPPPPIQAIPKLPPDAEHTAQQEHPKKRQSLPNQARPALGSDNTTYGNVASPTSGSGNTFVGPTDAAGNTVIRGGTAIGRNAHADPTSVAIGANAGAGTQPPANEQQCQTGSICNQNSTNNGTQTVVNGSIPGEINAVQNGKSVVISAVGGSVEPVSIGLIFDTEVSLRSIVPLSCMSCGDGRINDADGQPDKKTIWVFWKSPALLPDNPITVTFSSNVPATLLRVVKVKTPNSQRPGSQ